MNTATKLFLAGVFLSMMFVLAVALPQTANAQYYTGNCIYHSYQICSGNNLYWHDSCGNVEDYISCPSGCLNNACQTNYNYNNYNNCVYHSSPRCNGNNLYWYDSCGNQQDLIETCSGGCYNNTCQINYNYNNYNYNYNNNNNYSGGSSCTYHAYRLCSGNSIYWYDSCGTQQDLYSSCNIGQTCQYGQCAAFAAPTQPTNTYVAHYKLACYGNNVSWYDSMGVPSGIYRNCSDANSCTVNSCANSKCSNALKCDGSTCAVGSADYNTYCSGTANPATPVVPATPTATPTAPAYKCGNGICETAMGETQENCPADCKINTGANTTGLSVSLFAKQDSSSNQWEKVAQVGSNSQVYFMVSLTNASAAQIDNVSVSANIPPEVSSLGNLQLDNVALSGDIVAGVNIGSIAPSTTKLVTFEGKTGTISSTSTEQATTASTVSGVTQSDSVSITFNPAVASNSTNQVSSAVSGSVQTGGFWDFLKRWYLWIIGALVLIFLFVIVFRRFSSEV